MLIRLFNSDSDVLLCVVARSSILNVITFPFSCFTVFQFVIAIQYSRNQHTLLQTENNKVCNQVTTDQNKRLLAAGN